VLEEQQVQEEVVAEPGVGPGLATIKNILYRDEDGVEDAAKLARKESLSMKLQQRPGKQELIDRNILYQASEDERKMERSIIGAKLIRRLSLRPSQEELEERNILKIFNRSSREGHKIRDWKNNR